MKNIKEITFCHSALEFPRFDQFFNQILTYLKELPTLLIYTIELESEDIYIFCW